MKNIHILPTNKPSNLYQIGNDLIKSIISSHHLNNIGRHIYITNNDEINEDWFIDTKRNLITKAKRKEIGTTEKVPIIICEYEGCYLEKDCRKIVLTTDQTLIKDGIQSIDDESIKWLINNPETQNLEVIYGFFNPMGRQVDPMNLGENHSQCKWKYKLILPITIKHKQQTNIPEIGKVAEEKYLERLNNFQKVDFKDGFVEGVNWSENQPKNNTFTTEQAFNLFKKGMEWMEKQIESDGKYGENYSFEQCFNDNIKSLT